MDAKRELEKLRGQRSVSNSPFVSPAIRPVDAPIMTTYSSQMKPQPQQHTFAIHEDKTREIPDSAEEDNNDLVTDAEDMEQLDTQTIIGDEYYESGYSEESEEEIDPAVQEDMDKFQATFKGIKERFRLINRIGEGKHMKPLLSANATY